MEEQRKLFEAWISGHPYEFTLERFIDDPADTHWPGQYRQYFVQLAWEAWQEALRQVVSSLASKARPPTLGDAAEEKRT